MERRPLRVQINGKQYGVTVDAKNRLAAAINEYKNVNDVGASVLGFAAFLRLFDLWWIKPSDVERIDSLLKVALVDPISATSSDKPDGVVTLLSAPSTWSITARDTFARLLQLEALNAERRGEQEEKQMWLHLRDIILNYERYEDGGIRFENTGFPRDASLLPKTLLEGGNKAKLKLRAIAGEQYRSVAGISGPFSHYDKETLARLVSSISNHIAASDYLSTADFPAYLGNGGQALPSISRRDLLLLNKSLLALDLAVRRDLRVAISQIANHPHSHPQLWQALASYTQGEHWHGLFPGMPLQSEQDELDFWDDSEYIRARSRDLAFYGSFTRPWYYSDAVSILRPYGHFWSSPLRVPVTVWGLNFQP